MSAERTELAQAMLKGGVKPEIYADYLVQRIAIHESLDPYLPSDLKRSYLMSQDLVGVGIESQLREETKEYVNHIQRLDSNIDAHIYVNYLGDLYGGQMIRANNSHLPLNHLTYRNRNNDILYIRSLINNRDEELAPEANLAFNYVEAIYRAIWTN